MVIWPQILPQWSFMVIALAIFTAAKQAQGAHPNHNCLTEGQYKPYYNNIISMTEDGIQKDLSLLKEKVVRIKANQARVEKIILSMSDSISSASTNLCSHCNGTIPTEEPITTVEPTTETTSPPGDCSTLYLCKVLNGTCAANCDGRSISGYSFCKCSKQCKCCLPKDPQDCPCGQDVNGGCKGQDSSNKWSPGHCKKTCLKYTISLNNHTCSKTGGEDCKCCAYDNVEIDFSLAKMDQTSCHFKSNCAEQAFTSKSDVYVSKNGLPQAVWVGFTVPVPVVKYSFQSRSKIYDEWPSEWTVTDGPTEYVFFGSNSADCSDKSAWTYLVEDYSGTEFTVANIPKTELVPGNKTFRCYGFYVTKVPGRSNGYKFVGFDNIKLYTTGSQELDLDNFGAGATSDIVHELPEFAFFPESRKRWWQSAHRLLPETPQSIWFQFWVPVVVTQFSFKSRPESNIVCCGPSSYEIFGSNAADCSDQSSWVILFEDHNIVPFTTANNPKSGYIPNPAPYRCYGIKVLTIPSDYGSAVHAIRFFTPRFLI